jgi:hypothetical protein
MKILHNIHTKFHNKLSFASEVITGDSLIQWREGDGTCNRHTTNACRRWKSSKYSYSQNWDGGMVSWSFGCLHPVLKIPR